jgi:hypothetical protein
MVACGTTRSRNEVNGWLLQIPRLHSFVVSFSGIVFRVFPQMILGCLLCRRVATLASRRDCLNNYE